MKTISPEDSTSVTPIGPPPEYRFLLAIRSRSGSYVTPIDAAEQVLIGRSTSCDVTIDDPSVSRRHAILYLGGETRVLGLSRSSRTVVDGHILEPGNSSRIRPGSILSLGASTVIFQRLRDHDGRPSTVDSAEVVVRDPAMFGIFQTVNLVARTTLPILILGETGSGKEVVAARIHERSDRAQRPFVKINCAALAESLLESELFGYEKGAFTGATSSKVGLIESAHRGTVFLDEIGEIPVSTQVKLLRTVEVGEVRRIGGVEPTAIDVRFVCATNRPIIDMVREGSFREDLYYRLNGTSIEIPPLRRRRREIIPLAEQFLSNIAQRQNRAGLQLTPDAREALSAHAWPGNVRELLNVIERAAALCQACEIRPDDLALGGALPMDGVHTQELPTGVAMSGRPGDWRQRSFPAGMQSREAPTGAAMAVPSGDWRQWDSARGIQSQEAPTASAMAVPPGDWRQRGPTRGSVSSSAPKGPLPSEVAELAGNLERNKIVAALEETAGNQTRTAKLLGISRRTLINKMLRYGIQRPRGI